jgi:hypothetical protein
MSGFEDCDDMYVCPDDTDLMAMRAIHEQLQGLSLNLDVLQSSTQQLPGIERDQPLDREAAVGKDVDLMTFGLEDTSASARMERLVAPAGESERYEFSSGCKNTNPSSFEKDEGLVLSGQSESVDLLLLGGAVQGGSPSSKSSGTSGQAPVKRTLYDFQKRDRSQWQPKHASTDVQDLRQLRKEKFQEFKSDPAAGNSSAYAQPPSGNFAPPAASNGGLFGELSTSGSFSETSERIATSFTSVSKQFSDNLASVSGKISWLSPTASCSTFGSPPMPVRLRVIGKSGAVVRQGVETDSPVVDMLPLGTEFLGLELRSNAEGIRRIRLEEPIQGWVSFKQCLLHQIAGDEDPAAYG